MKKIFFFLVTLLVAYNTSFAAEIEPTCKRYFDGCNQCSRAEFGSEMACTMMACAQDQAPKCLEYFTETEMQVTPPSKACTREYMPVCAQPPMPACPEGMMCAQVMPQPKTYGNKCSAEAENAQIISQGECEAPMILEDSGVSEGSVWDEDVKICTMEYAPVCGVTQVQCIKAPCYPVSQTYGNKCGAEAANAKVAYEWECISPKLEVKLQNALTKALDKVPAEKQTTLIEKVIKRIDVLLSKDNLSEFKKSVLGYLKTLLQAY